jgi:DNA-binding SARP family transcriptional activator
MRFEEVDALVAGGGTTQGTAPPAHGATTLSPPPASSAGPGDAGAPSLQVLALGPLEIRLHGQLLSSSVWPHSRPREILLYLLAHGQGRTREQIRLAFWPDLSSAQAKNNFHVVLHRLRRVLGGNEWVVLQDDRYRINPDCGHELDAVVFERRITEELREARAGRGSAERLRAVLALYRGDFLEGETVGDWHMEIHDHLRRLYVDGLGALADLQMESGDLPGAAETLERLVTREELREDAYRLLMHCLTRAGQRERALRHYARLQLLLRDELQAEPDPETRELAERIRGAGV